MVFPKNETMNVTPSHCGFPFLGSYFICLYEKNASYVISLQMSHFPADVFILSRPRSLRPGSLGASKPRVASAGIAKRNQFASNMQASRCLFQNFYALTQFPPHICPKRSFSLQWETHVRALSIRQIMLLDPLTGFRIIYLCHFPRSCRSVARSLRYVFAPCPL